MTSTTFFIIFIPILSILLLFINLVLAPHNPYQEKDSVFECGFNSFLDQNRTQFSISFFIFALLFLLFDLEILLVYPYSVSSYNNDLYGLVIMIIFFILLTLGFVFELGKGALSIDSKQTSISTVIYTDYVEFLFKENSRRGPVFDFVVHTSTLAQYLTYLHAMSEASEVMSKMKGAMVEHQDWYDLATRLCVSDAYGLLLAKFSGYFTQYIAVRRPDLVCPRAIQEAFQCYSTIALLENCIVRWRGILPASQIEEAIRILNALVRSYKVLVNINYNYENNSPIGWGQGVRLVRPGILIVANPDASELSDTILYDAIETMLLATDPSFLTSDADYL